MHHKSKQAAASVDITPCVCVYIYVVHGAELMKHVASCTSIPQGCPDLHSLIKCLDCQDTTTQHAVNYSPVPVETRCPSFWLVHAFQHAQLLNHGRFHFCCLFGTCTFGKQLAGCHGPISNVTEAEDAMYLQRGATSCKDMIKSTFPVIRTHQGSQRATPGNAECARTPWHASAGCPARLSQRGSL